MVPDRCRWAIAFVSLHTRCDRDAGHEDLLHEGPGLAEFPYQRISWLPGDRREYETDRDEPAAWEDPS